MTPDLIYQVESNFNEAIRDRTLEYFSPQTQDLFKRIGYLPTPMQVPILLCLAQQILVAGGIQAGKSVVAAAKLMMEFPRDLRKAIDNGWTLPLVYWLVGNQYSAVEREWAYLQDHLIEWGYLRRRVKKLDPGTIEIIGGPASQPVLAVIRTKSGQDFRTLRAESPSGILGCEASELDLITFKRIQERLVARKAWMFMSGTMEGGFFPKLHREWQAGVGNRQSFSLPSPSNYHYYPAGMEDQAIKDYRDESTDENFLERMMGVSAPVPGMVYKEFRPDFHVADVVYDKFLPIQIWEDPGHSQAHALEIIQIVDGQVRIIDEIYERGQTLENIIEGIVKNRPWWKGEVQYLVSDPHYRKQHHSTNSVEEIWKRLTGLRAVGERERLQPRIERTHSFLQSNPQDGTPRLVINPRCKGILSEVGCAENPFAPLQDSIYRYRVDRNGEIIGDEPEDKNNHGWEAVGRGLVFNFGYVNVRGHRKSISIRRNHGGSVSGRGGRQHTRRFNQT